MSAEEFGDLDGGAANAAAGGKNKHGFTGLELRASDEHVPGGLEDDRDGGGMSPIEVFGVRKAIDFGAANIFGAGAIDHAAEIGVIATEIVVAGETGGTFAAGDAGRKNDLLTNVDGGDFRAKLDDFTDAVAAGNVRKRDLESGKAAANPEVEMVEGAGTDADKDFVAAELRFGYIRETENGWITVFLEDDGFHERPPRSETYGR